MSYFLVMMQSFADLAIGFCALPLLSYICLEETKGSANCIRNLFVVRLAALPSHLSLLTLTAMTVDRYIGVLYPLKHRTLVTKKRILLLLCLGTSLVHVVLVLSLFQHQLQQVFYSASFLVFLFISVSVYTRIYLEIRKREQPGEVVENKATDNKTQRKFLQEIKLAKSCFLVVACFVLSFLVAGVFLALNLDKHESMIVRSWAMVAIVMNASINSVIFFWSRPLLRNESLKVLKHAFSGSGKLN